MKSIKYIFGIYNPLLWKNIQNKFKNNTAIEQTFCYNKIMNPIGSMPFTSDKRRLRRKS